MARRKRQQGSIDKLPSGALRVRVYAGVDPISKRRLDLTEIIPAGPRAEQEAERVRVRLLNEVHERRNPRTRASMNQLLDRYLATHEVAPSTRERITNDIEKHIRPLLGKLQAGRIGPEELESFYAELRRCRDHCDGKKRVQHRTSADHMCDEHRGKICHPPDPDNCEACRRQCRSHRCQALGERSILKIHWTLSGAFEAAVRWGWIASNPCRLARKPAHPPVNPKPPSVADAARIASSAARRDADWGALIWFAMVTGARRGEICALRWSNVDLDSCVVEIDRAIGRDHSGGWAEGTTKTHQQRRIVIDKPTVVVMREHRTRCERRAAELGVELRDDTYVFSPSPDGATFATPSSITQRYRRLASQLTIDTTFHRLRHYSATELLSAGVDLRAVAGRLGHGSGGATTMRVYLAWTSEADQRASNALSPRMPTTPKELLNEDGLAAEVRPIVDPQSMDTEAHEASELAAPYLQIAADLRAAITCGALSEGDELPPESTLAARYGVAASTAHRAITTLHRLGLVDVSRGRRAKVATPSEDA